MNKMLLGLAVLVAGLIFGWYALKGNNTIGGLPIFPTNPTPTSAPSDIVTSQIPLDGSAEKGGVVSSTTVVYTDNGFSPKQVTVKMGTKVTFTNESAKKMWVASGVHPTHQLLPGFDQLTAVGKGVSYTYVFAKVGTWSYHSHVNATDEGVVVVTQ